MNALLSGGGIKAVAALHSRIPYSVPYQGEVANTSAFVHANLVGSPTSPNPIPVEWIHTGDLTVSATYRCGIPGPDSLGSDGFRNLEQSRFRRLLIWEQVYLEFQDETLNTTNIAVFAAAGNFINSSDFDVVTATANALRQLQMAIKLVF